jgi:hypothetical protein
VTAGDAWHKSAADESTPGNERYSQHPLESVVMSEPVHELPFGDDHQDGEAEDSSDNATEYSHEESLER